MVVIIVSEKQIERINKLENKLNELASLPHKVLATKSSNKAWSILEIMKHLCIAHEIYQPKAQKSLSNTSCVKEVGRLKCSFLASWMISKTQPKNNGEIQMKMKTMKVFQPEISAEEQVIEELRFCLSELKSWVSAYRTRPVSLKRFNSAIGPLLRFNLPEACEFILAHMERHFVQMEKCLAKGYGI